MIDKHEPKTIYITATQGPRLSICGYCRKVTGNVTAIISTPFYELVGTEYASVPEMLSVRFKPVEHCTCIEEVLKVSSQKSGAHPLENLGLERLDESSTADLPRNIEKILLKGITVKQSKGDQSELA